ncbi:MAG: hydroxyisourate hydrolase [Gammaproteobacteria bacterium]|nr:hydroxyisourate hydrolase [Gammaproteobacteria bacterium]
MNTLTTHVLDQQSGLPGKNIALELFLLRDEQRECLMKAVTNEDGRTDAPLLQGTSWMPGEYELIFHVGNYFRTQGLELPHPPFLDKVVIRFGMTAELEHYHVPLLVSPYGYTTYRGS